MLPLGWQLSACETWRHTFPQLGFSNTKLERMFWQVAYSTGDWSLCPTSTDEWAEQKITFRLKKGVRCGHNKQCRCSSGRPMSGTYLTLPIRSTRKRLSLVPWTESEDGDLKMKKVVRLEPNSQRVCRSKPRRPFVTAKSIWRHFRITKRNSIMEATNWVCAHCQDNHDWISEYSLVVQETHIH